MAVSHSTGLSVRIVEFSDRPHYQMQYTDPVTRRKRTRSTGVERTGQKKSRTEAERVAAKWEAELREGRYHAAIKITWADFVERYENEVLSRLSIESAKKVATTFRFVEQVMRPTRLSDLTSDAISRWIVEIHKGRRPSTVGIYCRTLHAALAWAVDLGLLATLPKMRAPRQADGKLMKNRPIVREEHERMVMAVAKVVPAARVSDWQTFLEALWTSGLRLGEAIRLSWEPTADACAVVVAGSHPVVRFRVAGQKARREEVWPCPPEFAQMLEATTEADRIGRVFKASKCVYRAGSTISAIGRAAGIVVDEATGKGATAHDYRRAFGTRWAKMVMPATLKRLMRHKDITTTMAYYVHSEAEDIANDLWAAFRKAENLPSGNTGGNTRPKTANSTRD